MGGVRQRLATSNQQLATNSGPLQLLLALRGLLVVKRRGLAGRAHLPLEIGGLLGVLGRGRGVLLGTDGVLLGLAAVDVGLAAALARPRDVGVGLVAVGDGLPGQPLLLDLALDGAVAKQRGERGDDGR